MNAISATTLVAYLRGEPVPLGDARLVFEETRLSYRRRWMSYRLFNGAGEELGAITPGAQHTAALTVGGETVLRFTVDRRGDTVVSNPDGVALGDLRRRFAVVGARMSLRIGTPQRAGSRVVGELVMRGISRASLVASDGRHVAVVHRDRGYPGIPRPTYPGAALSQLDIATRSSLIPPILVVGAVPALDAMRRSQRRSRFGGGS